MKKSKYVSKIPDAKGWVNYTDEEEVIWHDLYVRQINNIQNRACQEYMEGIDKIGLSKDKIPQLPEVNERLLDLTGWQVASVPALIDFETFFKLMADKKFPAATFIRTREEMDYLQEPDIFHEIFGHCPLLSLPVYADFMHEYAQIGLSVDHATRVMLARLYWFTIEFGLIQTQQGLRIYGGGILSSYGETKYALESNKPLRKPLNVLDAFRTPYRIDIFQSVYFVIPNFDALFKSLHSDLLVLIEEARKLGMHKPLFPPKEQSDEAKC